MRCANKSSAEVIVLTIVYLISNPIYASGRPLLHVSPTTCTLPINPRPHFSSLRAVCPSDCGDVLRRGWGDGTGVHRYLPRAREQRHGVQPTGTSQQGPGHQHCWGGVKGNNKNQHQKTFFKARLWMKSLKTLCVSAEMAGPERHQ